MTRLLRSPRLVLAALALAGAACNQVTVQTPIRSFDGPTDAAMVCVMFDGDRLKADGTTLRFGSNTWNPLPLESCTPDNKLALSYPDPSDPINKTIYPRLQSLVTQSTRGEVAYVDVDSASIIDLDPANPGFNFLPVGKRPEQVRASADGCLGVTANAGSCDLAVLALPTLYNLPRNVRRDGGVPYDSDMGGAPFVTSNVVRNVVPTVKGRPLGARPTWVEFAPENTPGKPFTVDQTDPAKTTGSPAECIGGSYRAWVALPGCELVAEVDLNTPTSGNAEVVRALRVGRSGISEITNLDTISCPAECAGDPSRATADLALPATNPTDLGAGTGADGGVPPRLPDEQAYPSALALDLEGGDTVGRLVVTDPTNPLVWLIPIEKSTGELGAPRVLGLADNALGVERARVSPRTGSGKFLYAVARDSSVRVIDLDREVECETHPDPSDPRFSVPAPEDPKAFVQSLACLPIGSVARSPAALTPGITLATGAIPRDVAFVHADVPQVLDPLNPPAAAAPRTLVGDFAWVISTDGRGAVVNLFDACPAPNQPLPASGAYAYTPACDLGNVSVSRQAAARAAGHPVPRLLERLAHQVRVDNAWFQPPTSCQDANGYPRIADENNAYTVTVNAPTGAITVSGDGGVLIGIDGGTPPVASTDGGVPGGTDGGGTVPAQVGTESAYPALIAAPDTPLPPVDVPSSTSGTVTVSDQCSYVQKSLGVLDPTRIKSETWSVAWEGTVGTARAAGRFLPGAKMVDSGASFCTRGVLAGDKVWLLGCNSDTDCEYSQQCIRDSAAPAQVTTGLCLDREPTRQALQLQQCAPLLRAVRRWRAVSVKQRPGVDEDQIALGEISQPEHPRETKACTAAAAADPNLAISVCNDIQVLGTVDGVAKGLSTRCLQDSDGAFRCLRPCDPNAATADGRACGVGYQCAASRIDGQPRCLRAPLDDRLFQSVEEGGFGCTREVQSYEVHAGEAFLVTGGVSGLYAIGEPGPGGECQVPPARRDEPFVAQRNARIPLDGAPACFPAGTTPDPSAVIGRIRPPSNPSSNVCALDATGTSFHFENPLLAFGIKLSSGGFDVPPDATVLSFSVVGGAFQLSIPLGVDVQAQSPASVVVGPDRTSVYVIDQGKQATATGLRGQMLRIFTPSVSVDRFFLVR